MRWKYRQCLSVQSIMGATFSRLSGNCEEQFMPAILERKRVHNQNKTTTQDLRESHINA